MNRLEVTENHNLSIDTLKMKIEIRKEQLLKEYSANLSNFSLIWMVNSAFFSGVISYNGVSANISGNINVKKSQIYISLSSDINEILFSMAENFIKKEIKKQLHILFDTPIPNK